ncbi:MAG TPA: CRISPR system precrRNA processing endoribonuclease RAMP protein Cas6 [Streptosporangiaceae bacterium]|nr:CRISPR system precrRNA processing endoribonuclease RAMP protein Cas6 [Streptosporangiaceae bacterium]
MPVIIGARITAERSLAPSPRELHYVACSLLETSDAEARHAGQDKPFTIWPLQPAAGPCGLHWVLRVGWVRADPPAPATLSLDKLRVGHVNCVVTETMSRSATHAQLAAGPVQAEAELTFGSPTYFSHNGSTLLTPDPRRMTDSWRRSWNTWLPEPSELRISDETGQEISKTVELADFELRTVTGASGYGRDQAGFVGSVRLRLGRGASSDARAAFSALARFAEFCGTGAQTTHGFGATRSGSGSGSGEW